MQFLVFRYALEEQEFINELEKIIKHAGFEINHKKTRLQYKDSKQTVTGLVVNKKINVDRKFYRDTKAMAHRLYKTGSFEINGEESKINQLEGRFSFINHIEQYNKNKDNKDSKDSKDNKDIKDIKDDQDNKDNNKKKKKNNKNNKNNKKGNQNSCDLSEKESEYRKFLFYRHFLYDDKPLMGLSRKVCKLEIVEIIFCQRYTLS